ncbi:hypothetical protein GXM_06940 [Nostoc sphaeroides CCNUC1]|uniref:Uncharacterized protein n=1 Tax=Nostoc sphaeroides CCNUC1 TaxID=2653204 RepID=A0A5P8WB98_9NOSO|nr:hypothetical protein GXM_06940 [Nostoc sphaeroides CCNUC1]
MVRVHTPDQIIGCGYNGSLIGDEWSDLLGCEYNSAGCADE